MKNNVSEVVDQIVHGREIGALADLLGQRVTHNLLGTGTLVRCKDGTIRTRVRWKCHHRGCGRRTTVYMDLGGYHPQARSFDGERLCTPGDQNFDCGQHDGGRP